MQGPGRYAAILFTKNCPLIIGLSSYLNGGFLADKQTAKAIQLNDPAGCLLIHKKIISPDGEIIISRISKDDTTLWQSNTGVSK